MDKKKIRKSGAAKSVRDLSAKAVDAKTAKGVTGGFYSEEHGAPPTKGSKPDAYMKVKLETVIISAA